MILQLQVQRHRVHLPCCCRPYFARVLTSARTHTHIHTILTLTPPHLPGSVEADHEGARESERLHGQGQGRHQEGQAASIVEQAEGGEDA